MATPVDIIDTLARCFVALESSFASGGTDVAAFPIAETLAPERAQNTVDVKTLHVRPFDVRDPVKSFKSGALKFGYLLQPAGTVLTALATVPTGANAPPLWVLMEALFGGQSVAAGSLVASAVSATAFSVTAAQGSRFPAGQLCLVEDPTNGLVACRVTERATDAVKVWPALSGSPSVGAAVVNAVTWYPTRTNSKSLRVRIANAQDANYQWEFIGGTGGLEFKLSRGELAAADFDLKFAKFTGPSPLGLSTANVTDTMDSPLVCRNAIVYLQDLTTTTRAEYPVESLSVKVNLGNTHLETLSGGTEGVRAVARTEGLQDTVATAELTFRADRDADTDWFTNFTKLACFIVIPVDTATGRRAIIFDIPRCIVKTVPKFAKGAGNMVKCTIQLEAQLDQACTGTLDNEQLAQAGIRIGIA